MKKYLGLLEESSAELKEIYGCEFTAYESWLKKVKKYEEIDGEKFKESDLNKIFKKPVPPTSESDEINESGDIIEKQRNISNQMDTSGFLRQKEEIG